MRRLRSSQRAGSKAARRRATLRCTGLRPGATARRPPGCALERARTSSPCNTAAAQRCSAAASDRAALVELLLEHGAEAATVKDANGDTPFGVAALREAARRPPACSPARPARAYLRLSLGGTGPLGLLLFELDTAAARGVANFLGFASGAGGMCYRGTVFHRLLPGQTLQGGQFKGGQFKGSIFGAPFADGARGSACGRTGAGCSAWPTRGRTAAAASSTSPSRRAST